MKKLLSVLFSALLLCGIMTPAFAAEEIPDGYMPICTAEDLNSIRNNLDGKYILMNDIDLSKFKNWTMIGSRSTAFTGILNGNGYAIHGLESKTGLFFFVQDAVFHDLRLLNFSLDDRAAFTGKIAPLAVYASNSKFERCLTTGHVLAYCGSSLVWQPVTGLCGGLIGLADKCAFLDCGSQTGVTMLYEKNGNAGDERTVGGLVGKCINSQFENCYSVGAAEAYLIAPSESKADDYTILPANSEDRVFAGGFAGIADETNTFKACYCSNQTAATFGNNLKNEGVQPHTNENLKHATTYQDFNFESVWKMEEGISYPSFIGEKTPTARVIYFKVSLRYKEQRQITASEDFQTVAAFESSNTAIAMPTAEGRILACGPGNATVTFLVESVSSEPMVFQIDVTVTYAWWQQLIRYFLFGFLWY